MRLTHIAASATTGGRSLLPLLISGHGPDHPRKDRLSFRTSMKKAVVVIRDAIRSMTCCASRKMRTRAHVRRVREMPVRPFGTTECETVLFLPPRCQRLCLHVSCASET